MPREARKELYFEFFHVIVQGINKEYIFNKNSEINTYLKYFKEKIKGEKLQIIAYCIMNNHAHFLIRAENIMEISKLMSQVNTRYAKFYNRTNNRCGYVFRNRYKSEPILTYSHLISCIAYIHNNPVKAKICDKAEDYRHSSYRDYRDNKKIMGISEVSNIFEHYNINIKDILEKRCQAHKFIDCIEVEDKENIKQEVLEEFLRDNNLRNIEEIKNNKYLLKELLTIMYIDHNFMQKEIAEFLGINRLKVHRLLNNVNDFEKSKSNEL